MQSEAKARWDKENSRVLGVKLMFKNDMDIIEYLKGKNATRTAIIALRYMIHNENRVLNWTRKQEEKQKEQQESAE